MRVFEKEWLGSVEVLPRLGEGGCEFIWRDANHGSILFVQSLENLPEIPLDHMECPGDPRRGP